MRMKKRLAVLLAVLFLLAAVPAVVQAEDTWVLDKLEKDDVDLDPIPLLIIKINYDADGDGKDAYIEGIDAKTVRENGEQWTHTTDSYWSEMCFSDTGKSLKNYYETVSNGSFYFYPAEETYADASAQGSADDGVVTVTIPYEHPNSATGTVDTEDHLSRLAALEASDEYVDYASFDKNGDGYIDYTELAILFVCGGYEYSSTYNGSTRDQFSVHAHYTIGSGCELDGVMVQQSGKTGFVRVGEYGSSDEGLTVGTIAHELGHFLGAYDLYDTDHDGDSREWNYASDMSLMSSGSHNSYSGERSGSSPAYMDPYHSIMLGFIEEQTVTDGTYTLYSRQSEEGDYNILKINTPNPSEYYLIENRNGGTESEMFDAISSGATGIVIWHIDESSIAAGYINNEGSGHDPGIVVMGTRGLSVPYGFFYNEKAEESFYHFDSSIYKFPVSGTAYTKLTEEQASEFQLKIDILSERADEMQIKITGACVLPPSLSVYASDSTTSSLTFSATIGNLNGGNVTSCGFIFSSEADYTADPNAVIIYTKPDEAGNFSYTFEELEDNSRYYCTAFAEGSNGRSEKTAQGATQIVPTERGYYIAHLYMRKNDSNTSYDVKLEPGEIIPDAVTRSMRKTGYVFGGWYLDEACTERFDLNSTQTECIDINLYAKWIEQDLAAELRIHNATSRYGMTFATEVGNTFAVPDITERYGYIFDGWYADEALTVEFDFAAVAENTEGVDIWAKWVVDESIPPETTATTQPPETTVTEPTSSEETSVSQTTDTDVVTENPGDNVWLIVIVAAAVIAAVAIIYILFHKKQKITK